MKLRIKPFTIVEIIFITLAIIVNNKTAEGIFKALILIIFFLKIKKENKKLKQENEFLKNVIRSYMGEENE